MAITKQKKEDQLKELIDKFGRSQSVVFADYRGLDVASFSDLRNKCREGGAEMKVSKKTLIKLAAKDNSVEIDDSVIEGPVVATFSYEDPLSGIQILYKFAKKNENLKLLGGIVDGKLVSPEEVQTLAKLPSREELLAKLIGSMNAPISGFVGIGGNLIAGIVRVLNAYKDTLPAEAAAPAATPEPEPTPEPAAEAAPVEEASAPEAEAPSDDTPAEDAPADEGLDKREEGEEGA
ncbi:MAG: 50S ribosomal protein L10 [Candidatus Peregrinibacteria bacterium]|nr:50S ribosomal protein L10 [Candidatus Peregrinibacteria bacterium]